MKPTFRSLLTVALVAGVVAGCNDSASSPSPLSPQTTHPVFSKINATDSTMRLTDIAYSDTALVLKRSAALATDISQSALIGPSGGTISIDAAGASIDIPRGALSAPTLITMKAFAGLDVAYDFQPHGLIFALPVKIQQKLAGTAADHNPALRKNMHGAYFAGSLDSVWTDQAHTLAKISENQLGYMEVTGSQIKFFVGHFSGYMFSCGRE